MLSELLQLNIFAFFLIFARIGTALAFAPGFSASYVSLRIRLGIGLGITFVVLPMLAADLPVIPATVSGLAKLLAAEVVVGGFYGVIMRILIASLQTAGTIAALASSMANALVNDPVAEQQSSTISGFLLTMAVVLIFVSDMHHMMIRGILESYGMFRPGEPLPFGDFANVTARQVADSFAMGLQMASPFMVLGLTYYIGLGLLGRLMPALPVFFFGLPIQITLQLTMFTVTISGIMIAFVQHFQSSLGRFLP
ncbi:MAG: flagellar biosynthetic protein FliR [Magnetovibrio sp.]|nr:flagellar biosynthetic protein FliR [Magnetovibrio sp.]